MDKVRVCVSWLAILVFSFSFITVPSSSADEVYSGQVTTTVDMTRSQPFVEHVAGQVSTAPNVVHIAGADAFTVKAPAGGFSILERTLIIERNINNALVGSVDRSPEAVTVDLINNIPVIRLGGFHIVTIDSDSALAAGTTMNNLATLWANSMRTILSNKARIEQYIANLGGNYILASNNVPFRKARLEAARLNYAAPAVRGYLPASLLSSDTLTSEGFSALGDRDLAAAVDLFSKAVVMSPRNSRAHYGLGVALLQQGKVTEGIDTLQMARWIEPDYAMVHLALGQAFEAQGRTMEAVKQYQEAALLQPDNPEPYLLIADIREGRNDMGKSVVELSSAVKQIPDSQYLLLRRKDQFAWRLKRPY
jgi:Flp pilus assembly protein TadD